MPQCEDRWRRSSPETLTVAAFGEDLMEGLGPIQVFFEIRNLRFRQHRDSVILSVPDDDLSLLRIDVFHSESVTLH